MRPLTLRTPKPLVRVNGIRMIETAIQGLKHNGIEEIYVVVGFMKEQFLSLQEEFNIRLIENPDYQTCNNISSLYVAREHLKNSIILDGDQLIRNMDVLSPEFTYSGYNAVWTDTPTKEWLMTLQDEVVTGCSRTGGEEGWQLFSISRWSIADGIKLKHHLEIEFGQKHHRDIYWDDIPMFCYPDEYRLGIRKMKPGDVLEIDTLEELAEIDQNYARMRES